MKKIKKNMPQFDQFSFFNQVSWFLFFFINFYFFITYFFLPQIAHNIKFRKKKIVFDNKKKLKLTLKKIILFFSLIIPIKLFVQILNLLLLKKYLFINKMN
jgi:hypothetical protein